jgi:hypothetical protein
VNEDLIEYPASWDDPDPDAKRLLDEVFDNFQFSPPADAPLPPGEGIVVPLRFPDWCATCHRELPRGARARWLRGIGVWCLVSTPEDGSWLTL